MDTLPAMPVDTTGEDAVAPTDGAPRSRRDLLVVGGLLGLVALPLIIAVIMLRTPRWYPVLDLAMTELRVRDVAGSHTPTIGLPGRIGTLAQQGSHPGPMSFYTLAPFYRLFGSSGWALQAATVVLNLAASGVCLVIARRRGGVRLALVVAAVLALLIQGYGITTIVEPWNPYLPLLWWMVMLLAVWSVACGDVVLLPVAAAAGSFCAQTHVPYLALALGLGGLLVVLLALSYRREPPRSDGRRRILRWVGASLGLGVLLWLPPLVNQVNHEPRNFTQLWDHFTDPPEPPVGLRKGIELELLHLDVFRLATDGGGADGSLVDASSDPDGSVLPGACVLAVWAAAAVMAWRLRHQVLIRLHLVVGVSLVLAVYAMSRIFGKVWYYLMLWSWGITALLFVAVGWTVAVVLARRLPAERRARVWPATAGALAAVVLLVTAVSTVDAAKVDPPAPTLSRALGAVLPATSAALDAGEGAATGHDGHYIVMWRDAYYFGSQAFGLVSELERRGFDARVEHGWRVPVTEHRVIDRANADAIVYLTTGVFIEQARSKPGAVEVAFVEPRREAELAEFAQLRADVVAELEQAGRGDLVTLVDENLFGVSIDPTVSPGAQKKMARMLELGQETAVFIFPPDTAL